MSVPRYDGSYYLSPDEVRSFCADAAAALPEWVDVETIGRDSGGKPIDLVTIGRQGPDRGSRPAVWIDAGTHASELAGVMAAIHTMSGWLAGLARGDAELVRRFESTTAYVIPMVCPSGIEHVWRGGPIVRSTLRPPREGDARSGLESSDVDGDGHIRLMRWRHPTGSFVDDGTVPGSMRPRTLDDDPDDAWVLCPEGRFVAWDGVRWTAAPLRHGLDLNRNFSSGWAPFEMFGMDSGTYALSEPESRALTDAFAARPTIGAALTLHTYTGCVLTQPYREDSPLSEPDLALMEALARDLVEGSSWRVFRVHPEFTYDPKQPVVGVWADTISTVFGVPGYTLELWDPFGFADEPLPSPAAFFRRPDAERVARLLRGMSENVPDAITPWRRFDHPQLGEVEIGGLDYLYTVRNPPVDRLASECAVVARASDRLFAAIPRVVARLDVARLGDTTWDVSLVLENRGMLPTTGLALGASLRACPGSSADIDPSDGIDVLGVRRVALSPMDGWGNTRVGAGRNGVYPTLPVRGPRVFARWTLTGTGDIVVTWKAGRAGTGRLSRTLTADSTCEGTSSG